MSDRFQQAFNAAASLLGLIRDLQALAQDAHANGITEPADELVRAVDWFRQGYNIDWRAIKSVDDDLTKLHGRTDFALFEGEPNAHRLVLAKAEQVMRSLCEGMGHEPGFYLNTTAATGGIVWTTVVEKNLQRICLLPVQNSFDRHRNYARTL